MMEYVMKKITTKLVALMVEIVVTFMPFGTLDAKVWVQIVHVKRNVMMMQVGVKINQNGIVMKNVHFLMVKCRVGQRVNELATNVPQTLAQTLEHLSILGTFVE
jgi:hypothetical protein